MISEESSLNDIALSIARASATMNNETDVNSSTSPVAKSVIDPIATPKSPNNKEISRPRPRSLSAALNQSDTNPNEICPICLLQIAKEDRSFAGTCYHTFCFECLLEWSKIKSSCPLCKQLFAKIYYKIKSADDYKEHVVKQPGPRSEMSSFIGVISLNSMNGRRHIPISYASNYMTMQHHPRMSVQNLFNNIRNTLNSRSNANSLSLAMCRWISGVDPAPVAFRRLVYVNEWRVSSNEIEITNSTTHQAPDYQQVNTFRDTSPAFYTRNQACTHRLSLFLSRELRALSYHTFTSELRTSSRDLVLGLIMNWIRIYDINSTVFLNHISHYIKPERYARHFQHEFWSYAQSVCHNVIDYDSKCVYNDSLNSRVDLRNYRLTNRSSNNTINDDNIAVLNLTGDSDQSSQANVVHTNTNNNNNYNQIQWETEAPAGSNDNSSTTSEDDIIVLSPSNTHLIESINRHSNIDLVEFDDVQSESSSDAVNSDNADEFSEFFADAETSYRYDRFLSSFHLVSSSPSTSSTSSNATIKTINTLSSRTTALDTQPCRPKNNSDDDSHSASSFCEEIQVTPKKSPEYILLSSDSEKSVTKRKRKIHITSSSSSVSDLDENKPTTSRNAERKFNKKKKKTKRKSKKSKKYKKKRSSLSSSSTSTIDAHTSDTEYKPDPRSKSKSKSNAMSTNERGSDKRANADDDSNTKAYDDMAMTGWSTDDDFV